MRVVALTQQVKDLKEGIQIMRTIKNISTAVSIMVVAISVAVIGSDHAMASGKKQRSSVRSASKSVAGNVRRSGTRGISDGTSNTIMVGERRSAAGVISPRDSASGLPTGIVSGNHAGRGARNMNPPGGWATFPSSRKGQRQR